MDLYQTSLAFKGCNGATKYSFKEKINSLNLTKEDLLNGCVISDLNNFILSDIHFLLKKAVLNIVAADRNINQGFFNWGFITSYYSNFYSIQNLNRLSLNFNVWLESRYKFELHNAVTKELYLKKSDSTGNTHENEFNLFFTNFNNFKNKKSINRFWTLGIRQFKLGHEPFLRNEINYTINNDYYYEIGLEKRIFDKIIDDNKNNPADNKLDIDSPKNFALYNIELAVSRIAMTVYVLNYMASSNIEYKSYLIKLLREINSEIDLKYSSTNAWLLTLLKSILKFEEFEIDEDIKIT